MKFIHALSSVNTMIVSLLLALTACDSDQQNTEAVNPAGFQCDADNGSLTLPEGFCAGVVADNLGIVRHLAVHPGGTIYVSQRHRNLNVGGLLMLSDEDGDGRMENVQRFSEQPGMGVRLAGETLYFASDSQLLRFKLSADTFVPQLPADVIVKQFPVQERHAGKPFSLDGKGNVYINIGALSNACQEQDLEPGSMGQDPCPELEEHAGIWRFNADVVNQEFSDGHRYASGIRNAYAIDWHPELKTLFVAQHGRDELHSLWPEYYSERDSLDLPAEELFQVEEEGFYGWPYCYFDQIKSRRLLSPEYGGDGESSVRCDGIAAPLVAFPGHFGPNDLLVYTGDMFPESYHGGVFIAFHGAHYDEHKNRVGFQVVFVEREADSLASDWQVFADDFAGAEAVETPQDAEYRPTGLAVGNDGSLYIADSVQGRIWRIVYQAGN